MHVDECCCFLGSVRCHISASCQATLLRRHGDGWPRADLCIPVCAPVVVQTPQLLSILCHTCTEASHHRAFSDILHNLCTQLIPIPRGSRTAHHSSAQHQSGSVEVSCVLIGNKKPCMIRAPRRPSNCKGFELSNKADQGPCWQHLVQLGSVQGPTQRCS
jgi:hypothetical protein